MRLARAVGELDGCHAAEAAVRTEGVVIRTSCLDDPSRRNPRWEQALDQIPVAQATSKAFDETILLRPFSGIHACKVHDHKAGSGSV